MRPDDLIEFSRQTYAKPQNVEIWSQEDLLDSGLSSDEQILLKKLPLKKGRLLLLGVGGGREAIPLARIGFTVTGVDFIPAMVAQTKENAARRGLKIRGLIQEISNLDVSANTYDIVWLSAAMYSAVPTRKRRVRMLRQIRKTLGPGGYFLCQFQMDTRGSSTPKIEFAKRVFAFLTMGNFWYEKGDILWGNVEFIHGFSSDDKLRSEFKEGGFTVLHMHIPQGKIRGGAVMRKS
ncbi:MAG: hypothetical protein AYK18_08720 [Theionarchaea archaeon DG-70]|nr:MAG: hypothetical protein AYK18_08720 [Theionarchaea archaeon DG-70]